MPARISAIFTRPALRTAAQCFNSERTDRSHARLRGKAGRHGSCFADHEMNTAPTLHFRTLQGPDRHAEIFEAFDLLGFGERLVVASDHQPKPLLLRFSLDRPGQFEWNVLEQGPALHRVEIVRRPRGGLRTVTDYLETDHRRLDALLAEVDAELARRAVARARQLFGEFSCGLERHMQAEEQVLFPVFERVTGMAVGPVSVMTREHALLRELVDGIGGALAREDGAAAQNGLISAAEVLELHNMKEERVIYPHTDRALTSAAERDALVLRMQGV